MRHVTAERGSRVGDLIGAIEEAFADIATGIDLEAVSARANETVNEYTQLAVRRELPVSEVCLHDDIGRQPDQKVSVRPGEGVRFSSALVEDARFCGWYLPGQPTPVIDARGHVDEKGLQDLRRESAHTLVAGYDFHGALCRTPSGYSEARDEWDEARQDFVVDGCRLDQQEHAVYDRLGRRWIRCETCGHEGIADEFASYGGTGRLNLGTCAECRRRQSDDPQAITLF